MAISVAHTPNEVHTRSSGRLRSYALMFGAHFPVLAGARLLNHSAPLRVFPGVVTELAVAGIGLTAAVGLEA